MKISFMRSRTNTSMNSAEGPDDMPVSFKPALQWPMVPGIIRQTSNFAQAHIKSALIGASVTIPIKDGKLVS